MRIHNPRPSRRPAASLRALAVLIAAAAVAVPSSLEAAEQLKTASAPAPQASGSTKSAPIPITVRVFDGNRFVSDLTLQDFEVEEAGMPVAPQALFLVRKDAVERREGPANLLPDVSRKLVLLFELTEYHNKIPEALDFLFGTELLPNDTLEIETPMRVYRLSPMALRAKPRATLARELAELVRKDIIEGGMAYNTALRELKRLVRQIGGVGRTGLGDTEGEVDESQSLEQRLMQYSDHLQQMENLRAVDGDKLVAFARRMKGERGQKLVFFVYQREFRPEISPQTLDSLVMANQDRPDIIAELQSLFAFYKRPIGLDREPIMQAFADSGVEFHFLFMNRQPERVSGINLREQSEDVFKALTAAAEATGGVTDTAQNPAASLEKALKVTEMSYILVYTPSTSAPPGTFIGLNVKVKGKNYRVAYRTGYLTGS